MSYFSYHGRNKKLIKKGLLKDYFYEDDQHKKFLVLIFENGKRFPIKEERWREYYPYINAYYKKGGTIK